MDENGIISGVSGQNPFSVVYKVGFSLAGNRIFDPRLRSIFINTIATIGQC